MEDYFPSSHTGGQQVERRDSADLLQTPPVPLTDKHNENIKHITQNLKNLLSVPGIALVVLK